MAPKGKPTTLPSLAEKVNLLEIIEKGEKKKQKYRPRIQPAITSEGAKLALETLRTLC